MTPDDDDSFCEFERAADEFFAELEREHRARQRVIDALLTEAIEVAKGHPQADPEGDDA